jgi:spermidine synthase
LNVPTPWTLLDTARAPGGGGVLRLYQRGEEFSITVGNRELMNSRVHGSEEALAHLACARLAGRHGLRLLIGGLGMGFTLAAALGEVGAEDRVEVAELVPAVIDWNRGPLAGVAGRPLDDPRVTLREGDVAAVIRAGRGAYDAILLDVDNGPEGLTHPANDWLYGLDGLYEAFIALRPGGVLAVWSAGPDPAFAQRLRKIGFQVEQVPVRARGPQGGARYLVWLASPGR